MKSWLKGGLILGIIAVFFSFMRITFLSLFIIYPFYFLISFFTFLQQPISLAIWGGHPGLVLFPSWILLILLGYLIIFVIWFIVGALICGIIDKIKFRK